jgi:hypothetical protein
MYPLGSIKKPEPEKVPMPGFVTTMNTTPDPPG